MKIGQQPPTDPRFVALAAADDASAEDSAADAVVLPCGALVPQLELKMLLWNVRELGGGFHMPVKRPDHCIDAYAAVIAALGADLCAVTGLRASIALPVQSSDTSLQYSDAPSDTGVAEAKRILAAVQKAAADGDWAIVIPADAAGAAVHQGGTTSALLYKKAGGRKLLSLDIISGRSDATLGVGGNLVLASIELPLDGADPLTLDLLIPLGAAALPSEKAPATSGSLPASFVLAFSAGDDLSTNSDQLGAVQSAVNADSRPPLTRGSLLGAAFWESTTTTEGALITDYTAVGPADVDLQDEAMHWEALPDPEHPAVASDVAGGLGDAVLLRNAEPRARYALRNVRVVDMLRATLTADELTDAGGDGEASDEDSVLADLRTTHRGATPYLGDDAPTTPQNIVAECTDFIHLLSDHWPVLATFVVRKPAPHS